MEFKTELYFVEYNIEYNIEYDIEMIMKDENIQRYMVMIEDYKKQRHVEVESLAFQVKNPTAGAESRNYFNRILHINNKILKLENKIRSIIQEIKK